MQRFLQILLALFIGLIIFYLTQIHYDENLFSHYNSPYTISGMIALVGALVSGIFLNMGKLKKPKEKA